eukprot:TRINITY_DN614_c0_g1_i1.p1 TRINITY_DN614_c0_g1~~TRINITY_DN614_c0_g1_i1.p1  ORF type:complete len:432 (+),score=97.69 TRINITY_DN614_c0_g1_i1:64-1359(+)
MGEEGVTLKELKDSLKTLHGDLGSRLDKLERCMQALLANAGIAEVPASESASKPDPPLPVGPPPLSAKPIGEFNAPARGGATDAAKGPGNGAAGPLTSVSEVAKPREPPPPAQEPPPPPEPPASLGGHAPVESAQSQSVMAVAAAVHAAQTPRGPQYIEVELKRPDSTATWGFLWDRPAFIKQQRIIDDIVPQSPAGRCRDEERVEERRLKKGDELVALNGKEGWDACSQLSKMTEVRLKFLRPQSLEAQPRVVFDQEPDPETVERAGDPRDMMPGTVPTPQGDPRDMMPGIVPTPQGGEQPRSQPVFPAPDAPAAETREKKIEKQMTLLRQLSESKKDTPGQASGVTSLMTQVDDLTKLANLLAQGEANEALALVQPLLRKQVRIGSNGDPEYAPVDATEAARFLLEVMEVMESSSTKGNAALVAPQIKP